MTLVHPNNWDYTTTLSVPSTVGKEYKKNCSVNRFSYFPQFTCKTGFGTEDGGTELTDKFACSYTKTDYTIDAVCYRECYCFFMNHTFWEFVHEI